MQYAEFGIRILIGTVFLAAAVGKTAGRGSFAAFAASLGRLNVVPRTATRTVAVAVAAAEWSVCLLILTPAAPAFVVGLGLALAAALLTVFAAAIARVVARGTSEVCRCFGSGSTTPLGVPHLVRNLLLAGFAVVTMSTTLLDGTAPARPAGLAVAAAAGLLAGGCVAALDSIVALFRPMRPVSPARPMSSVRPVSPVSPNSPNRRPAARSSARIKPGA
ncbi:MauE/DoxX family redox-associated membrane protein [Streptomyces sp. NPDC050617]|uniref:MauE/DoxX family redox-associated membrane protein n=1 Tax=Streptomyces sp. NPDC050617 TaxID=3154628 RepID=UPI0034275AC0